MYELAIAILIELSDLNSVLDCKSSGEMSMLFLHPKIVELRIIARKKIYAFL